MRHIALRHAHGQTDLFIAPGLLGRLPEVIAPGAGRCAALVTDETVYARYGDAVRTGLQQADYKTQQYLLPAGESAKSTETLLALVSWLAGARFSREDAIFALGGGAVTDVAGFAAGVYLRGVPCVYLPTTLLAQVDAAVGGKTAVNLPEGKNMLGLIRQPDQVLVDPESLSTLSTGAWADGMSEAIKTALVADGALFEALQTPGTVAPIDLVDACIRQKAAVVERDEVDSGARLVLNFGHTLGHAFETLTGFSRYSHGQAVAAGMVAEARVGQHLAVTPPGLAERIAHTVRLYGLPDALPLTADEVCRAALADKKRRGSSLCLPFPVSPGCAELHSLDWETFTCAVRSVLYHI